MSNPYSAYRNSQVLTASPLQLVHLAYEGIIAAIADTEALQGVHNLQSRRAAITKAQLIIGELRRMLDFEAGGDIAKQLARLYDYMQMELRKAFLSPVNTSLQPVKNLLVTLDEAWGAVSTQESRSALSVPEYSSPVSAQEYVSPVSTQTYVSPVSAPPQQTQQAYATASAPESSIVASVHQPHSAPKVENEAIPAAPASNSYTYNPYTSNPYVSGSYASNSYASNAHNSSAWSPSEWSDTAELSNSNHAVYSF
jgi:flagellar protein FliS